jgi:hypothetical protein
MPDGLMMKRTIKYRHISPPEHITGTDVSKAKAAGFKQEYDSDKTPFPQGTLVKTGHFATARAKPDTYPTESASFKKGGKVKKTGKAKVHKGEVVLTREQVQNIAAMLHF